MDDATQSAVSTSTPLSTTTTASTFASSTLRTPTVTAVSVSISSYAGYLNQRDCVKLCLYHAGTDDDLLPALGCGTPWANECLCNAELASTASNFLSGCVASRCTAPRTDAAVTSAVAVYNDYCSANGYSIPTVASILYYSAYISQPSCVQQCLWHPANLDDLMPAMGCRPPWDNDCLCNASLASTAGAFISTCVASRCGTAAGAPQVTAARSVYAAYCEGAGFSLPAAALAGLTTTTAGGASSTASSEGLPAETAAVGRATGGAVELSAGAIAGIVVGCVVGLAVLLAAAAFVVFKRRRARAAQNAPMMTPAGAPRPLPPVHEKSVDRIAAEVDGQSRHRTELPG